MPWTTLNDPRFSSDPIANMSHLDQPVRGRTTKRVADTLNYQNMSNWSLEMIKQQRFSRFHEMDLKWLPLDNSRRLERRRETNLPLDSDAKTVDVCFPNDSNRWLLALVNQYGLESMATFYKATKILYKDRLNWLKEKETPATLQQKMNNIILSYLHSNFTPDWIKKLTDDNLALMKVVLDQYWKTTPKSNEIPNLADLLIAKDELFNAQSFDNKTLSDELQEAVDQARDQINMERRTKEEIADVDYWQ